MRWIRWLTEVGMDDVGLVGGKNASLGEMLGQLASLGVAVPGGYAVTAQAYDHFIEQAGLGEFIRSTLDGLDHSDVVDLTNRADRIRDKILGAAWPRELARQITEAYGKLSSENGVDQLNVAVRSSATAEDLPNASFAGQQDTFLNVRGEAELLDSVKRCIASLFTPRAVSYREDMGFNHMDVSLSVGVQRMVRSDLASSGVIFTLDTESGFRDVVMINSAYGLGENVVQGNVVPDEMYVHKPTLKAGFRSLIWRRIGPKELRLTYDESKHRLENQRVPDEERVKASLTDDEVIQLAKWAVVIEDHYTKLRGTDSPMDIEWAKDGISGDLFIVQARPETVQSQRKTPIKRFYEIGERTKVLAEGRAVGDGLGIGPARVVSSTAQMHEFKKGEVLVTKVTDPDWEPVMKIASAIVTDRGGRTSHAAIVSRELGVPAVVGTQEGSHHIANGQVVTVCCAEGEAGRVYEGALDYKVNEVDPSLLGETKTKIMLNLANPEIAFKTSQLPNDGVGLARMEFIFAGWVNIHPLALTQYNTVPADVKKEIDRITVGYDDKKEFFVDRLSQGIATLAAAFYPKPVILRLSDFKSNEYAHLIGGQQFEGKEENPMIGWRGASRYYNETYIEGFVLELEAVKRVRNTMGLTNLKLMVPFCRTPEEGKKVLGVMADNGLVQGEDGLEVYVMAEVPSNVLLADQFAEIFDGFSIGSNDLTQLMLGVDRDSEKVQHLFDERSEAVKRACSMIIQAAKRAGKKVGICGQGPSDYPDFAAFLVGEGIDSISLVPDAIVPTKLRIIEVEAAMNE